MSNATTDPPHPVNDGPLSPGAAFYARFVTSVLVILTPTMIGVIGWRWFTVREPSTAVVISGDGSLDGAHVTLHGASRTWTRELTEADGWEVPFLLHPGDYHVQVTHHGRSILSEEFKLEALRGTRYELPSLITLVGGPQFEKAELELQREEEPGAAMKSSEPVVLTFAHDDHYRTAIYLPTGVYQVVAHASATGDVIAKARFRVDRTSSVRVDLVKAIGQDGVDFTP